MIIKGHTGASYVRQPCEVKITYKGEEIGWGTVDEDGMLTAELFGENLILEFGQDYSIGNN